MRNGKMIFNYAGQEYRIDEYWVNRFTDGRKEILTYCMKYNGKVIKGESFRECVNKLEDLIDDEKSNTRES